MQVTWAAICSVVTNQKRFSCETQDMRELHITACLKLILLPKESHNSTAMTFRSSNDNNVSRMHDSASVLNLTDICTKRFTMHHCNLDQAPDDLQKPILSQPYQFLCRKDKKCITHWSTTYSAYLFTPYKFCQNLNKDSTIFWDTQQR